MAVSRRFYVFFWPFQRLLLKQGGFSAGQIEKMVQGLPRFRIK